MESEEVAATTKTVTTVITTAVIDQLIAFFKHLELNFEDYYFATSIEYCLVWVTRFENCLSSQFQFKQLVINFVEQWQVSECFNYSTPSFLSYPYLSLLSFLLLYHLALDKPLFKQ